MGPAGADMLARARHGAIGGIQIHLVVVGDVAQHAHALEHVDVFTGVRNARQVIKILRLRFPVGVVLGVDDHHGRASRRKMHAIAADIEIVRRVLAVESDAALCLLERGFHDLARHAQPAIVVEYRAHRGAGFDAVRRGLAESDLCEDPENVVLDSRDIGCA